MMDNGDGTPVMVTPSSGAADSADTDDDSTDDDTAGSSATTCVHTADGFIRCGDVVGGKGKRDGVVSGGFL